MVHVDLKESAQHGMGPHGLLIGATGSGKSELLRTLLLGLAMTHSPEHLNMVLVDFKGGATFSGLVAMPHVSSYFTNIDPGQDQMGRLQETLTEEMTRRQELLRGSGNYASIRDYDKARAAGEDMPPIPALLIVVDEFTEMITANAELIDSFVAIGRLGRSLGLHMLFASQRLDEGRMRGLESLLSYRIGLRTFSAEESRTVLGVPDSYDLPAVPGLGYLKPDPATLTPFRAAYVSGATDAAAREHWNDRHSLLDALVNRMRIYGAETRFWSAPLDRNKTLDHLLGGLAHDADLGLTSPAWRSRGDFTVPLGMVEHPREGSTDLFAIDLEGARGHVAVVGGPRSGKSTLLRTLVASTSLVRSPGEVQFYVLDFGGGTFAAFADLPHLAGLGTRSESDVVRRIVAELSSVINRREEYFRSKGIDSIEAYRSARMPTWIDDGYGDLFLVIDGWSTLMDTFPDLEQPIMQLATRGLAFGLHLTISATRWSDIQLGIRDMMGSRLELRLGDPTASQFDPQKAADLPIGKPGRGLTEGGLKFQAALPRIDGIPEPESLGDGVSELVKRIASSWAGAPVVRLRELPARVELAEVRASTGSNADSRLILLGIQEKDMSPVSLDVNAEPHALVFGAQKAGKTSTLRTYASEVMRSRTPKEAQLVVIDYRRSLLGEVPDEYLLNYVTSPAQAGPTIADLSEYLKRRIPGPDITPDQLRKRSWWTGAEVFVIVDDYDLVATASSSPVAPLQPLLAQARDVGLHLIVARTSGGASRALYEPVIQSLRDLAMPGLLLSGSPEEGPLLGKFRPEASAPGRGRLVSRDREAVTVQVAWVEPQF